MTYLSQLTLIAASLSLNSQKGSTYGQASTTPSSHSFQQSPGSGELVYANRIQVLCGQITLYPLYSQSIISG